MAFIDAREIVESGGDSLLGTTVAGRFTILSRPGAGPMGAAYRAHLIGVLAKRAVKQAV